MKSLSAKTFQCGVTIQGLTTLSGTVYLTALTNTATWDYIVVGTTAQGQLYTRTYAQIMSDITSGIPANANGTTNYISKFTGSTTLGNSQIFDNGTNIGIGTASPAYTLDINGSQRSYNGSSYEVVKHGTFSLNDGTAGNFNHFITVGTTNVYATSIELTLSEGNIGHSVIKYTIVTNYDDLSNATKRIILPLYSTDPRFEGAGGTYGGAVHELQMWSDGSGTMFLRLVIKTTGSSETPNWYWTAKLKNCDITATPNTTGVDTTTYGIYRFTQITQRNSKVGIGTSSPTNKLTIQSNSTQLRLETASDPTNYYSFIESNYNAANPLNIYSSAAASYAMGTISLANITGVNTYLNSYYGIIFGTSTTSISSGTVRMMITNSGNVGIGTTTPAAILHSLGTGIVNIVESSNAVSYTQYYNSSTGAGSTSDGFTVGNNGLDAYLFQREAANLILGTSAEERMRITSSGNVGIGTSSPNYKLSVATSGTLGFSLQTYNSTPGGPQIDLYDSTRSQETVISSFDGTTVGTYIASYSNHPLLFGTYAASTPTAKMAILPSGNVGIGDTDTYGVRMHIAGVGATTSTGTGSSNIVMLLRDTTAGAQNVGAGIAFAGNDGANTGVTFATINGRKENATSGNYASYLSFQTRLNGGNLTEQIRITSAGNVGIGTTSPSYKLQVNGDENGLYVLGANTAPYTQTIASFVYGGNGNSINIENQGGKASIQARVGGSTMQLHLNSAGGNVLIGTTTDAGYKLDVSGTGRFSGNVTISSNSSLTVTGVYNVPSTSYFKGNATYGYRFNNAADTVNLLIIADSGAATFSSSVTAGGLLTVNVPTDNTTVGIFHAGGGTANRGLKISTFASVNDNAGVRLDAQTSTGVLAFATVGVDRLTIASTGAATFSSSISVGSRLALQPSNFGYASSYKTLLIGSAGTDYTTNAVSLAFNVDVSGNPSGAFNGSGQEYIWRNAGVFITPNAANTSYNTLFGWNSSGQVTFNHAATFSSSVGIARTPAARRLEIQQPLGGNAAIIGLYDGGGSLTSVIGTEPNANDFQLANAAGIRFYAGSSIGNVVTEPTNERMRITSTGNVLIGKTADNGARLQVSGDGHFSTNTDTSLFVVSTNSAGDAYSIYANTSDADNSYAAGRGNDGSFNITHSTASLYTGGTLTSRFKITSGGNVGIGTGSPAFKLETIGTARISGNLSIGTTYNGFAANIEGTVYVIGASVWVNDGFGYANASSNTGMFPDSSHNITFKSNNSTKVYINAAGNVGIGTTGPNERLQVVGNINSTGGNNKIGFNTTDAFNANGGSTAHYGISYFGGANYMGLSGYFGINFFTEGTERMRITSAGNVGIGTTSPSRKLIVYDTDANIPTIGLRTDGSGTTTGDGFDLQFASSNTFLFNRENGYTAFGTNNTERMRITNTGNVGIGTTSPDSRFTVKGDNALVDVQSTADGQTIGFLARYLNSATLGGAFRYTTGDAQLYIDNFYEGNNGVYSDINIRNCDTGGNLINRIKIKGSSGNVGIGTTSPSYNLDVNGNVGIIGSNFLYFGHGIGNGAWTTRQYASGSTHKFNAQTFIFNNEGYGAYEHMALTANGINLRAKNTIDSTDSWLRLNQSGDYGSGVYTPGLMRADGGFQVSGSTVWHAGNDGSGSGLDADLLDGNHASVFATRQDGARYTTNYNSILSSGFFNGEGTPTNAPNGYGQLIVAKGIDTGFQIAGGYSSNAMWFRGWGYGPEADGFYPWRRVWHDGDFSSTNISNWNTAYGWGNHASAGYLTSYSETDTLASVTGRGATTSTPITVTGTEGREVAVYIPSSYTTDDLVSGHEYGWYSDHWRLGMTRSGGAAGADFVVQWNASRRLSLTSSGNLTATGTITATGGNSSNWNTAYSWGNHASASYATTSYVTTQINNLINGAPGVLDTLDELAAALGDDANFATTVTNSIAGKVSKSGDTMTGALTIQNGPTATWDYMTLAHLGATARIDLGNAENGFIISHENTTTATFATNGNLTITGALIETSSIKVKENIETSEGNLEKVVNLRPVTYNKIGSQTTELGLIAEEVAEVYPEFVQYDENGEPVGVHYSRLTAALIGAVKELTNQVQELNKKING